MIKNILIVTDRAEQAKAQLSVLKPFYSCQCIEIQQYLNQEFKGFPQLVIVDLVDIKSGGVPPWLESICKYTPQRASTTFHYFPAVLAWIRQEYKQKQQLFQIGVCDYFFYPLVPPECLRRVEQAIIYPVRETIGKESLSTPDLLLESCRSSVSKIDSELLTSTEKTLAKKLANYLLQHLSQDISLNELAQVMGSNRNKLGTAFKASYGSSIFSWIRKQRMHKAARLLCQSSKTILQVAEDVGYMDSNNFSTAFKREFQFSPKQYRQQKTQMV